MCNYEKYPHFDFGGAGCRRLTIHQDSGEAKARRKAGNTRTEPQAKQRERIVKISFILFLHPEHIPVSIPAGIPAGRKV